MNRYHWLWLGAAIGLGLHALGLGWDVYMHAQDSTLAAREGIFTLENPSHLLIIAGMAIATVCIIGVAITWLNERRVGGDGLAASILRVSSLPVVAVAGAASIWLVSLSEDSSSHAHDEDTVAHVHDDGSTHMHDAGFDQWVLNALASQGLEVDVDGHTHGTGATSGTDTVAAVDGGAEEEGDHPHFHEAEFDVSPEHLLAAAEFYANLKSGLAPYEDISYALGNGFVQITPDVPGIAGHFLSYSNARDGVFMDPSKPEQLLYSKRLDGSWRLVGAMFVQPYSDVAPSYFGGLDAWHYHENRCIGPGGAVQIVANEAECTEGTFKARTNWMLHVWTAPGADGAFAHDFSLIDPGAYPGARVPAAEELGLVAAR